MDATAIAGVALGIVGVIGALAVMWAIASGGITKRLIVRPAPGIQPVGRDELWSALMSLDDEGRPWTVRPCPEEPRADFVAEWRLADARWWELASRNGLRVAYRAWFALEPAGHELRCLEQKTSTSWSAGAAGPTPVISWNRAFFQGVVLFERTREVVFGLKDEPALAPDLVVAYDFDPWRVKGPLIRAALQRGWSYRPATGFGQLKRA